MACSDTTRNMAPEPHASRASCAGRDCNACFRDSHWPIIDCGGHNWPCLYLYTAHPRGGGCGASGYCLCGGMVPGGAVDGSSVGYAADSPMDCHNKPNLCVVLS